MGLNKISNSLKGIKKTESHIENVKNSMLNSDKLKESRASEEFKEKFRETQIALGNWVSDQDRTDFEIYKMQTILSESLQSNLPPILSIISKRNFAFFL